MFMARHRTKAWRRNARVLRDQRIALDLFNPQVTTRIERFRSLEEVRYGTPTWRSNAYAIRRGLRMSIVPKDWSKSALFCLGLKSVDSEAKMGWIPFRIACPCRIPQ
jgi:hypothetical protein